MNERQRRYRLGLRAESLAALRLRTAGYRILARRTRTPVGEIDLIARRGRLVAFVEVKARRSQGEAAESLTPAQQKRIVRAAEYWLASHPALAGCDVRFDLLLVAGRSWPVHVKDAWRP